MRSSSIKWVCRHRRNCWAFTPTCLASFQSTLTKRLFPGHLRHWVSQPMRRSLTSVCSSYIKRESLTGSKWVSDRRHYTESRTHPSASRLIPRPRREQLRSDGTRLRGRTEGLTRDDILDNITFTWLTNTAVSRARLYWENRERRISQPKVVSIPGSRERLPGRALSGPAQLGGAGVSQAHRRQQTPQRRPLRGLGTAATLRRRCSRGLQIAAAGFFTREDEMTMPDPSQPSWER